MVKFQRLDKNSGIESASPNIITSQHPFSPKNFQSSHKTAGTLLKTKHIPYLVQNPQKTSCMSCHTTTPKILDTLIFSLVLVPTEMCAITQDHFLTFLAQWKSFRQDSSHFVLLIKFCFYLFTTPQNQNQITFF